MGTSIKKYHLKQFVRLTKELQTLLWTVREYCPEAEYRLNTCENLEFGLRSDNEMDYPYYVSERLDCESINDVGSASYSLLSDEEELELHIKRSDYKQSRQSTSSGLRVIRKGSKAYEDEVFPFYTGYKNTTFGNYLSEKEFAKKYLHIELVD